MDASSPTIVPELGGVLPVARTFTRADLRRSLHHLMLATDRRYVPDVQLDPRARQRFVFRCGACGTEQIARVWDIASQRRCSQCHTMMIIPAPGPRRLPRSTHPTPGLVDGVLYCPRCGRRIEHADRSRQVASYCPDCRVWF